jgi:tetraacyldisaccharide 4'-kinase
MRGARYLMAPLALTFGAAAAVRRATYQLGVRRCSPVDVPVISVGGLSLGGSGKTPVTIALAERLSRQWGVTVGVVHGGYRGRAGARVQRVCLAGEHDGAWYGDEATLLARRLPEAVVVRGPDKALAVRGCAAEGADVVLIDDGLQHLRVHRDLEIVVAARPPALPFPLGDAREFGYVARSADLRWWHQRCGASPNPVMGAGWGHLGSAGVISTMEAVELVTPAGRRVAHVDHLVGLRVHLIAGIAAPQAFRSLVERCGAHVVGTTFVGDHRSFSDRALARCGAGGADVVLCSEKDAARCPRAMRSAQALALRCRTKVLVGESVLDAQLAALVGSTAPDRGEVPTSESSRS